jgi:pyruvate/2-oxoglutarate dehydrogenase complex dihydrolipoamide acyltransferase (E2) component
VSVSIRIPRLGVTVQEVTLLEWKVQDGDRVAKGDVIAVMETDKVETELEAPADGVVEIDAELGGVYPIGAVIGEVVAA